MKPNLVIAQVCTAFFSRYILRLSRCVCVEWRYTLATNFQGLFSITPFRSPILLLYYESYVASSMDFRIEFGCLYYGYILVRVCLLVGELL